jgi:hypothetical protein
MLEAAVFLAGDWKAGTKAWQASPVLPLLRVVPVAKNRRFR